MTWDTRRKDWLDDYRHKKLKPKVALPNKESSPAVGSGEYAVFYFPIHCPQCRSKDNKCYSSHPPIRYHVCNKCGYNFKSVEVSDENKFY